MGWVLALQAGLFVLVGSLVVKAYLPAYARKKGELRAEIEDSAKLTSRVEGARAPFVADIQRLVHEHDLRLAVLKERFRAHQEAWGHWLQLMWTSTGGDRDACIEAMHASQKWWQENGLYLEPQVRDAFWPVSNSSRMLFDSFNRHGAPLNAESMRVQEQQLARLQALGPIIEAAVGLPSMVPVRPPERADP